jgi:hypothetical protein
MLSQLKETMNDQKDVSLPEILKETMNDQKDVSLPEACSRVR